MKRQCRCGLREHFLHFRAKRLGVLGIFLMVAHILFHVVECLVLPAVLVGLGSQASATSESENIEIQEPINCVPDSLWQGSWSFGESTLLVNFEQSLLE